MLIDSHAHLDGEKFDNDRDDIIKNLKENNVEIVINPGADMDSSLRAVELSNRYDIIYSAVGIHPHDVKDINDETINKLRELSSNKKVIGIGEIGLDYYYDNSPREIQKHWFRKQIKLAKEVKLPIIVHDRDAHQDTFDIIKDELDENLKGVLHCYSGGVELAKEYIKMGFFISFAGPVTFKNAKLPKEVAKEIPLDKILIETDSPYLSPHPNRGKRNEPKNVYYIAEMIAQMKNISFEEVMKKTNENTRKLFNIY